MSRLSGDKPSPLQNLGIGIASSLVATMITTALGSDVVGRFVALALGLALVIGVGFRTLAEALRIREPSHRTMTAQDARGPGATLLVIDSFLLGYVALSAIVALS